MIDAVCPTLFRFLCSALSLHCRRQILLGHFTMLADRKAAWLNGDRATLARAQRPSGAVKRQSVDESH